MPAGSRPSCDVGRGAKIFAHHAGSRAPAGGGESQIAMPKTKSEAPAQGDAWGWGQR